MISMVGKVMITYMIQHWLVDDPHLVSLRFIAYTPFLKFIIF